MILCGRLGINDLLACRRTGTITTRTRRRRKRKRYSNKKEFMLLLLSHDKKRRERGGRGWCQEVEVTATVCWRGELLVDWWHLLLFLHSLEYSDFVYCVMLCRALSELHLCGVHRRSRVSYSQKTQRLSQTERSPGLVVCCLLLVTSWILKHTWQKNFICPQISPSFSAHYSTATSMHLPLLLLMWNAKVKCAFGFPVSFCSFLCFVHYTRTVFLFFLFCFSVRLLLPLASLLHYSPLNSPFPPTHSLYVQALAHQSFQTLTLTLSHSTLYHSNRYVSLVLFDSWAPLRPAS